MYLLLLYLWKVYFNSRTHKGCDVNARLVDAETGEISTHAPQKGATGKTTTQIALLKISTHAPTKGATCMRFKLFLIAVISTHAPTKGATANIYKKGYEDLLLMHIFAPANCGSFPQQQDVF